MKLIVSAFVLASGLVAHAGVHAQVSLLRVTCEGSDIGAEVTINGKLRGECPLDIEVGTGTLKLRVVKKLDNTRERVFEEDIRILSTGVSKRVEAVLSAPRLNAEAQRGEGTRLTTDPAQDAKRAQSREVDLPGGRIPPRPQIPVAVSEDTWKIIEASEAYRNLPRPRAIKIRFQGRVDAEFTGARSVSMPKKITTSRDWTTDLVPLGDRCVMEKITTLSDGVPDSPGPDFYRCGFIKLGSTYDGKPLRFLKGIDELQGSLFPMRIGAVWSIRSEIAYVRDRRKDYTNGYSCEVVSNGPARELDARLSGTAWKLHCQESFTSGNKPTSAGTVEYYLEELGAMLSSIGVFDSSKHKYVIPSPGYQTEEIDEAEHARITTTYTRYDWTVGK